jgi:hypothetical protein
MGNKVKPSFPTAPARMIIGVGMFASWAAVWAVGAYCYLPNQVTLSVPPVRVASAWLVVSLLLVPVCVAYRMIFASVELWLQWTLAVLYAIATFAAVAVIYQVKLV